MALLLLLLLSSLLVSSTAQSPSLRGLLIDCGASTASVDDRALRWLPDGSFVSAGAARNLSLPGLDPILSTLRSFPFSPGGPARKFCYSVPVNRRFRYLVRTTYFYGSAGNPPVFDQIVDGTFWTAVNSTADNAAGMASNYEGVFLAQGKTMSVCVAGNPNYTEADPFISALELIRLEESVYNGTNFNESAMGLIARSKFGSTGQIERYPADRFDRFWQPYTDRKHAVNSTHNLSVSDIWNIPPVNVFNTALVAEQEQSFSLQWPPISLPNSSYYIALYFADMLSNSSRSFNVYVNDYTYYSGLTVTSSGLVVFATQWNLSGLTTLTLTPNSALPPLINAGEVFGLFSLGRVTHTRDVTALENMKKLIKDAPDDWNGDPCMPQGYSWSGVTCVEGSRIRVVSLNLSSMALSGSISASVANLTALTDLSFAGNNFTGHIPDLGNLKYLEKLHLQDNQLTGTITQSLGNIESLSELFLQNNNLTGKVPDNLLTKPGLNLKIHPGNPLLQT